MTILPTNNVPLAEFKFNAIGEKQTEAQEFSEEAKRELSSIIDLSKDKKRSPNDLAHWMMTTVREELMESIPPCQFGYYTISPFDPDSYVLRDFCYSVTVLFEEKIIPENLRKPLKDEIESIKVKILFY